MLYLVCYDITKDSRRVRVAKLLETYGMRVQQSVFELVLNEQQYATLEKRLVKLLDRREDQLRFYPLPPQIRDRVTILGVRSPFAIDDPTIIV
jgi:CRISPR-associated protein Cas2